MLARGKVKLHDKSVDAWGVSMLFFVLSKLQIVSSEQKNFVEGFLDAVQGRHGNNIARFMKGYSEKYIEIIQLGLKYNPE